MAEVIWTTPALNDFERILEFIELDDELAAKRLAQKVFETTDRLSEFPESGRRPRELAGTPYRRLIVGPVLIYHRRDANTVYVVHLHRSEMKFSLRDIKAHDR